MDPGILLLIIIGILLGGFLTGRALGLIRTLIPIATAFLSFWVLIVIIPVFKADAGSDLVRFELQKLIVDVLAFAVTYVLIHWLIRSVLKIFRVVGDAPVVGPVNRILGGVAGFLASLVGIWTFFFFGIYTGWLQSSTSLMPAIQGNGFVRLLYNHNLVMTFVNYFIFAF